VTAVAATLLRSTRAGSGADALLKSIHVKDLSGQGWSPVFGLGLALAPADCGASQSAEDMPWTGSTQPLFPAGLLSFKPAGDEKAP
jgi:hypothetical protein